MSYLHDKLPPPRQPPLRHEGVDGLLLPLGLLDLDQPRDGVDRLAAVVGVLLLLDLDEVPRLLLRGRRLLRLGRRAGGQGGQLLQQVEHQLGGALLRGLRMYQNRNLYVIAGVVQG